MESRTPGTGPSSAENPRSLCQGHLIDGKYKLKERLGEGARGVVYRAVHVDLEKDFAIKLLKTSGGATPIALERFRREAIALGRLRHPNIVEVTDCGIDASEGSVPYIVTELVEGEPLSDICHRQAPLPLAQALPLLGKIADAIDTAHNAGVLHRDLKPGNVLVCAGDSSRIKVLDFGLAKLLAGPDEAGSSTVVSTEQSLPALTTTAALLGTPLYVAPELIRLGEASRSSDIYSFGVLAYEMLGGRTPFRGTVEEVLFGHLESDPAAIPVSPEIWCVLRETLRKDPTLRPGSAGEVVRQCQKGMAEAERACWRSAEIPRSRSHQTPCSVQPPSIDAFLARVQQETAQDRHLVARLPRELFVEYRRLADKWARQGERDGELGSRIEALERPFFCLTEKRADLTRGTVLLTYYIGESRSFLFVTQSGDARRLGFLVYWLAVGRERLKWEVEAFQDLLTWPTNDDSALREHGQHLYDLLVRPAEPVLCKAERWLISPDGPLRSLPFATLFCGTHFLAARWPIYSAPASPWRWTRADPLASRRKSRWQGRSSRSHIQPSEMIILLGLVVLFGAFGFLIGRCGALTLHLRGGYAWHSSSDAIEERRFVAAEEDHSCRFPSGNPFQGRRFASIVQHRCATMGPVQRLRPGSVVARP